MKEIKLGTEIELTDEALVLLKNHIKSDKEFQQMLQYANSLLHQGREEFWTTLIKMYPELKDYRCLIDFKTETITVVEKLEDEDK